MDCLLKDNSILKSSRIMISKRLYLQGFSQKRIARALGCSQAMVSKYLKSSPSPKHKNLLGEMEALSKKMEGLVEEGREKDALFYFCQGFFEWKERGLLCDQCRKKAFFFEALGREGERRLVLEDLKSACRLISENSGFSLLVPQVRMNIACSINNPSSRQDIASIPGRLVFVGGKLFAAAPPQFGVSGHLADMLLRISKVNPRLKSVMNVRLAKDVLRACRKARLPLTYSEKNVEVLLADKGGFGREPCLYIFASSALEAAQRALGIAKNLETSYLKTFK